ncbi:MAG: flagellar biosynthesis protein FlhB [Phycisphaeraceae bacterium]|nr:flagellar biosynthesis protein FlhB [Phycisphaeraceae bacterium]
MAEDQEKTEAPTPRRRLEARQEGNVVRSQDLTAAAMLLAAIILLHYYGLRVFAGMKLTMEVMLGSTSASNPTRVDDLGSLATFATSATLRAVTPLMLCIAAVGLLATVLQVGFIVTTKPLEPSLAKLSPLKGLKNIFDMRAGFRLVMSLLKIGIVGAVAVAIVIQDMPAILMLAELDAMPMFGAACALVYALALKLAAILLILALIDWAFQKWRYEQDLRMSKQEIKEEMKRMEGDPLIKQRRARVARQLAMQRIGQAVPKADVIVTNPTHFAVALKYDAKSMKAPKVVAKGADFLAMRIRQLAIAHGVPMVERKQLAQDLYKSVEVGREVPPQLYNAVAEILAYVYRLSGRKSA